jgi:hypothetical protein
VTQVRCEYRHVFKEPSPYENSIRHWDSQLKEMSNLLDKERSGRPSVSVESLENIRNSFIRSSKKSMHKYARGLGLPEKLAIVFKKRLRFTGLPLNPPR